MRSKLKISLAITFGCALSGALFIGTKYVRRQSIQAAIDRVWQDIPNTSTPVAIGETNDVVIVTDGTAILSARGADLTSGANPVNDPDRLAFDAGEFRLVVSGDLVADRILFDDLPAPLQPSLGNGTGFEIVRDAFVVPRSVPFSVSNRRLSRHHGFVGGQSPGDASWFAEPSILARPPRRDSSAVGWVSDRC